MALVNVMYYPSPKLPPNFLSKSGPSAICRILSETRSTKRIPLNYGHTNNLFNCFFICNFTKKKKYLECHAYCKI